MLRALRDRANPFGRRDAERLLLAAFFLVLVFAVGVAVDLAPSGPGYTTGSIAPTAIRAPRAAVIPNAVETKEAQVAAASHASPVYDYTAERASA